MATVGAWAAAARADVTLKPSGYRHATFSFDLHPVQSYALKGGVLLPGRAHISKRRLQRAVSHGRLLVGRHRFDPAPSAHLAKRKVGRYRLRLKLTPESKLRWPPPLLHDPTTVSADGAPRSGDIAHQLTLSPTRDYVVRMPAGALSGGLVIQGGHNVLLVGGEINVPMQPGNPPSSNSRRGLYLTGQTGTVHIEGLGIQGPDLSEGINLSQDKGAVVQIENVRVDDVHARDEGGFSDNHPDVLQTWAGPAELRVDRLSGSSDYQGFFLAPNQFGTQASPRQVLLSRVDLRGGGCCYGYLLWLEGSFPMHLNDVWVTPHPPSTLSQSLFPTPSWSGVREGSPPNGQFVPTGVAGSSYISPGYR